MFDPTTIDRGPEVASDDFPGGTQWIRRSVGVDTVIVNGAVTWSEAEGTRRTLAAVIPTA